MPIGHAIMVLNEKLLVEYKLIGAALMGVAGVALLIWGVKKNEQPTFATIMGLLGGILVWTGWIEFSFVWAAERYNVAPLMEHGEIATKPEYLVMLSSIGLLATITLIYLFTRTNFSLFIWLQKAFGLRKDILDQTGFKKPVSLASFSETIVIIWFFYILLLVVYDNNIAGDNHPATHIVAWGSLIWSLYLIAHLVKIQTFDYAVRYAIPTVIIFWNFIEVLGRWGTFEEIWIHPLQYWLEVSMFFILLAALLTLFLKNPSFSRKKRETLSIVGNIPVASQVKTPRHGQTVKWKMKR
ncbi:MAG: hypothetical protein LC116_09555 [Bacteroidetes bacterium]|nr:hypothetical protein [Bacteroidota bacterium]